MAFQNKNLSVIAYANGFTLWHYTAADTSAVIGASGYFNSVSSLMNKGDLIIASGSDTALRQVTAVSPNVTTAAL